MPMLQPKSARLLAGIIGLSKCICILPRRLSPTMPAMAFSGPPFWLRDFTLDYYWNLIGMPVVTRAATNTSGQGGEWLSGSRHINRDTTAGSAVPDLRLHTPASFIPRNINRNGYISLKG